MTELVKPTNIVFNSRKVTQANTQNVAKVAPQFGSHFVIG